MTMYLTPITNQPPVQQSYRSASHLQALVGLLAI